MIRALSVSVLSVACGPAESPALAVAPSWPAGTVLAVDDVPLCAPEIELLASDVGELYPEYSPTHRRRLALTNAFLQRAACRAQHPEAWASARATCQRARDELDRHEPRVVSGTWRALGLELWSVARRLESGRWSEPIELVGRFALVRLDERTSGAEPAAESLRLALLEFPYLEPAEVQVALDHSRLVILDSAWGACVPEDWKHRMRGSPR